ncbi:MAG: protein phosphatase 2C domain-containing protein [Lachnospiraceae bacterium]|nr:protein phosphatase 2C domain-containing protein [Lachnospiraceae bacterium]
MRFFGGVLRDRGEREKNEDSLSLSILRVKGKEVVFGVVADGIGSLPEGDAAGGYVCEGLRKHLYGKIVPMIHKGKRFSHIRKSILLTLYSLNEELKTYGERKGIRLGTTVSLLLVIGRRYLIVNVGDSAVFCITDKERAMKRLTPDDHNPDGSIGRCIGSFPFLFPYVRTGCLFGPVSFLVASDGFYKRSDHGNGLYRPGALKDRESVEKRLGEGIKQARKRGEKDNASAVLISTGR